jgi:hypothetical protein
LLAQVIFLFIQQPVAILLTTGFDLQTLIWERRIKEQWEKNSQIK